uniref:Putative secreted protein n=1 Tax=Anopheles marajoara TaxID=58244 RepID=A0A2M4C8B7_9DIPT
MNSSMIVLISSLSAFSGRYLRLILCVWNPSIVSSTRPVARSSLSDSSFGVIPVPGATSANRWLLLRVDPLPPLLSDARCQWHCCRPSGKRNRHHRKGPTMTRPSL